MREKKTTSPMAAEGAPTRIWNTSFTSVFVSCIALFMSQMMMNSLVAKYAYSLGATETQVGLTVSMFAVTALLFRVVSGPATDSFNRKFLLIGAMLVLAGSYLGYSFSGSVGMLQAFRLLQGAGMAFTSTVCLTLAADALPPDKMGVGIGVFSMTQAASQAIGPATGLALVDALGYGPTFTIGAIMMIVAVLVALGIKTRPREKKQFKVALNSILAPEAVLPAIMVFFLTLAFVAINSFLIIYAEGLGVFNIGYYFTVYAGTLLVTRPIVGKLTDRYGIVKIAVPAMCFFAASFVIISHATNLPMFLIAAFIAAFGYGACQPAFLTLCVKCVPENHRGAASSTTYVALDIAMLSGPVIAGLAIEQFGYNAMWQIMIAPMLVSAVIALVFRKKIAKIETDFALRSQTAESLTS